MLGKSTPCDIFSILKLTRIFLATNPISTLIYHHNWISGAYYDKMTQAGISLSDQMLLGSVVATNLVVVVTAQVTKRHNMFRHFF